MLGACRAGITSIVLPKENEPDLEEIREEERERLAVYPVETLSDVLAVALLPEEGTESGDLGRTEDKGGYVPATN